MPGMNGLELTRRPRSHHWTAQVPIIMLSALRESADVLRGYAEGSDEYQPKPIAEGIPMTASTRGSFL